MNGGELLMELTTNLNLKKPGYNDPVDIQDINYNMDLLDLELKDIIDTGGVISGEVPPEGVIEGRLWLDTSEQTYGDTILEGIVNMINEKISLTGGTFTGPVTHGGAVTHNSEIALGGNLIKHPQLQGYSEVVEVSNVSGIKDINLSNANIFVCTLIGETAFNIVTPANGGEAYSFTLVVSQPTSLPVAIIFPASIKWDNGTIPDAPTENKKAVYTFFTTDGGVTWYGSQAMNEVV